MALVPPEKLCRHCDVESLGFETTAELEDLTETIGQERAIGAIEFSLGMVQPGYNLFALGPPGIGRHRIVRNFVNGLRFPKRVNVYPVSLNIIGNKMPGL